MLRRLSSLLFFDLKLMARNRFVHVVLLLAVVFIGIVSFLAPKELKVGTQEYVYDGTEGGIFQAWLEQEVDPKLVVTSEEDLRQSVQTNPSSVGIILKGSTSNPQALLIRQGYEPESAIKLLVVAVDALWEQEGGGERRTVHSNHYLRPQVQKLDFNLSLLPIFLALEVVMLGFLFAAVMVFQEKGDGIIRAYRVGPGGTGEYILSKLLANLLLSLLYGLLVVGIILRDQAVYGQLVILIVVASSLMTLLGMGMGVYFDRFSGFLYPAILILMALQLPLGAYFFPAFNLRVFQFIPTYQVLFGLREILFPSGRPDLFYGIMRVLLPQLAVVSVFCYLSVRRQLMREVG